MQKPSFGDINKYTTTISADHSVVHEAEKKRTKVQEKFHPRLAFLDQDSHHKPCPLLGRPIMGVQLVCDNKKDFDLNYFL